jgi:PEP-CTERM motif
MTCAALVMGSILASDQSALAGPLTPGALIVSVNDFTGGLFPPTFLAEYTTAGTRVQKIADVPPAPTPVGFQGSSEARGNVLAPDGKSIYLFNASTDSYLANYNLTNGIWTQQTTPGWGPVGNVSYGAVGVFGKYVFASNTNSADGGVLRFDTTSPTISHFGPMASIINLSVDAKGMVYALDGQIVYEFNGSTLASLGQVNVGFADNRAVAAAADGTLYVASWAGDIQHFSATGTLLSKLTIAGDNFESIAINDATGQIALGTGFTGQVVLTDLALGSFTHFVATDNVNLGGEAFVSWVSDSQTAPAVPEPSSLTLLGVAAAVLACRPSARAARRRFRPQVAA